MVRRRACTVSASVVLTLVGAAAGCRSLDFDGAGTSLGDRHILAGRTSSGGRLTVGEVGARRFISRTADLSGLQEAFRTHLALEVDVLGAIHLWGAGRVTQFDPSIGAGPLGLMRTPERSLAGERVTDLDVRQLVQDNELLCFQAAAYLALGIPIPTAGACPVRMTSGDMDDLAFFARRLVLTPRFDRIELRWRAPVAGELSAPTLSARVPVDVDFDLNLAPALLFTVDITAAEYDVALQPALCTRRAGSGCIADNNPHFDGYRTSTDNVAVPDFGLDVSASARMTRFESSIGPNPLCVAIPFAGPAVCAAQTIAAGVVRAILEARFRSLGAGMAAFVNGLTRGFSPILPGARFATFQVPGVPVRIPITDPANELYNNSLLIISRGNVGRFPPAIGPAPEAAKIIDTVPNASREARRIFVAPLEALGRPPAAVTVTSAAFVGPPAEPDGAATFAFTIDSDGDGFDDTADLCPGVTDTDVDGDGRPDDTDGDGIGDACDLCGGIGTSDNGDYDGDGLGNGCDCDIDGDTCPNNLLDGTRWLGAPGECAALPVPGFPDQNPRLRNPEAGLLSCPRSAPFRDVDCDGIIDDCDNDYDNDGIPNESDNCPRGRGHGTFVVGIDDNPDQTDTNGDDVGDLCDLFCSGPTDDRCTSTPDPFFEIIGAPAPGGSPSADCARDPVCQMLADFEPRCAFSDPCPPPPGDPPPSADFLHFFNRDHQTVQTISSTEIGADQGLGPALASVPDLDGDGLADFVVGSPGFDACSGSGRRRACQVDLGEVIAVSSRNGAVLWRLRLGPAGSRFGAGLASFGTLLAVGAPGAPNAVGAATGSVYFFDVSSGPSYLDQATGADAGEQFGASVVLAPDVTGDGIGELLVSAPRANGPAGLLAGRVDALTFGGNRVARFDGPVAGGRLGSDSSAVMARAQGPAGVLAGAPNANSGAGLVVFFSWDGAVSWVAIGAAGENLGASIAPAADFDADGSEEIAVGAAGANGGRGVVRVFDVFGRVVDELHIPIGSGFGTYVAVPGDVDRNGTPDLTVTVSDLADAGGFYAAQFLRFDGLGGQKPPKDPIP